MFWATENAVAGKQRNKSSKCHRKRKRHLHNPFISFKKLQI